MQQLAPTVLIVEDDISNNRLMSDVLNMHGFRVEAVHDGQAALDLFGNIDPSLVIMDIGIPTVDGLEVCRRMRIQSNVPILMVTGRADRDTVNSIMEAGANAYLAKPFDIDVFAQRAKEIIKSPSDSPLECVSTG